MSIVDLIDQLADIPRALILALVGLGQAIEYIFPPAPADSLTLAASVLASRSGAGWVLIAVSSTLGSIIGSIAAWYIGDWIVRTDRVEKLKPAQKRGVDRVLAAFEKHGAVWLCTNRFLPGLRAFFFIAAAMAGIPLRVSVAWSAISALLWSLLIVAIGVQLATNLEVMVQWLHRVQTAGLILAAGIAFFAIRYFLRARKNARIAMENATLNETSGNDTSTHES